MSELFSDVFKVDKIDPDGKKFEKVSRIEARGEKDDMYLLLDVATAIYPMEKDKSYKVVLASISLDRDGTRDTQSSKFIPGYSGWYSVMQGKLYRISEVASSPGDPKVEIHASFGGLLIMLKGDLPKDKFELDQRLFILVRKA